MVVVFLVTWVAGYDAHLLLPALLLLVALSLASTSASSNSSNRSRSQLSFFMSRLISIRKSCGRLFMSMEYKRLPYDCDGIPRDLRVLMCDSTVSYNDLSPFKF